MTPVQIEYFLTLARCLSFTEASNQLFITQPALSRQISAIEAELNMLLFIRGKKSIKLTPAGEVLLKELPAYNELYNKIVANANRANLGLSDTLRIGILDGHVIPSKLSKIVQFFEDKYPNIQIIPERFSFGSLSKGLINSELDIIITLSFDIDGRDGLEAKIIQESDTYMAMPRTNPLANKDNLSLCDFKNETFICVSSRDCEECGKMLIRDCRKNGFYPKIKYAPNLATVMLWVEAGLGITVLNESNSLINNSSLIFKEVSGLIKTKVVMVWKQDNYKPAISLFTNKFGTVQNTVYTFL